MIQTSASGELIRALKAHAAIHDLLLFDVFVQAMDSFVECSKSMRKKRHSVPYLISPKGSKDFNVRLPEKLGQRLQTIADRDEVPHRRLVYTAHVHFAVAEHLIPPMGTLQSGVLERGAPTIAEMVQVAKQRQRGA